MSGRVRESCCENNDAFREGIAHKSLWKLIARKRPPSFSFYFRQSPRPLRYLSPVNPCSEGDTRSSLLLFSYTSSLFSSIRRVVIRDIRDLDDG